MLASPMNPKFSVSFLLNPTTCSSTFLPCHPFHASILHQELRTPALTTPQYPKPSRSRICHFPNCTNKMVSRKLCVRHGGGSRCQIPKCPNRAKLQGYCFQHGGYKVCLLPHCKKKAKCYGYCSAHGGGQICKYEGCRKVATYQHLCWAHGGGKRCLEPNCAKRAYQKHNYYCFNHFLVKEGRFNMKDRSSDAKVVEQSLIV